MFVTPDSRHVIVPWREDLASLIPQARELPYQGERMLVLPNEHDVAKLCRNVGLPVPSPILTKYQWPGNRKPWEVQKATASMLVESPRAYVLSEIGTGKTGSAIYAADYLLKHNLASRVLIAAPLSVLSMVWEQELFKLLPEARVRILHGSRAERVERLKADAEWFIVNHHGLLVVNELLLKRQFDVVILDELAIFRNRRSQLWKAAAPLVAQAKYAWGMTGSPRPRAPTDAWAQVKLLTPERTTRTMIRFRDMTMYQVGAFTWKEREGAATVIQEAMQPSVRFTREQVQEIPETTYLDRKIEMEPETRKFYRTLVDRMAIVTANGQNVTAVNEGVLQNKLLQVACGYVYTDKKTTLTLPNKTRLDALQDLIDETERKVIVFVPYIHALDGVAGYLQKQKVPIAVVSGATPAGQRNRIFNAFQNEAEPRVLVAHPECMAHGLTLTAANTIIWFCAINRLDIYEQANGRIVRPSQTSKTLIAHLVGTPVEKIAYKRLKDRGTMQGVLLELFQEQQLEF